MNKQRFASQKPKAAVLPFMAGISLLVFLANAHAAAQAPCPLGAASTALEFVESVALAVASQTAETCIFNQGCVLESLAQTAAASWLFLAVTAAALWFRAALARKVEH